MCRSTGVLHALLCFKLNERNLQTSKATKDIGALQKGADFVKAFALGFDVNVTILRDP
jgi:rRNA processing protein Krr1/Pno1